MKTEIEIPVGELKSALPGLAKIVGRSRTLPVLGCIKVSLDREQQFVSFQASNLDEIATFRLPNQTRALPGELLVSFEMLSKIVKGCSAEQSVRLIADKKETKIRYTVAGSSVDRAVEHIPIDEWPPAKVIDQESFPLDEAFKQTLKEALETASTDSSRYVLNGACLDITDKAAHHVVGTDARHLYSANSFDFRIPESLIIPTQKFVVWAGFQEDGPWKLRMLPAVKADPEDKKADKTKEEPPWLQIDSDHWTYIARAIDGKYPNWRQVVPSDMAQWNRILLAPESVQMMQQAVPLLPGGDTSTQTVVLEVAANRLWVKGRGRDDKEDTRMAVPDAQLFGKPFEIALNRTYLLRALRFGFHEIRIQDELSPLVFLTPNKTMVVSPVRLDCAATPVPATPVPPVVGEQTAAVQNPSPNENAPPASPSAAVADNLTETTERQTMSSTTVTKPANGNLPANANGNGNGDGQDRSSFKAALEHIERIKTNLRDVISDLGEAVSLLKAAEKEQRATTKEIDTVRSKLREIQSVKI